MSDRHYYCERCQQGRAEPGFCQQCQGEPLLDLRKPQTWEYFAEEDERGRHRRSAQAVVVAAVVGMTAYFVGSVATPLSGRPLVGVCVAIGTATVPVILKVFPSRRRQPPADIATQYDVATG